TLISSILGCIIVSVIVFGNDTGDYYYFMNTISRYLLIHTSFALIFRMWILYRVKRNLVKGKVGFRTLMIGGNQQAINIYKEVMENPKVLGNQFQGFIYSNKESSNGMSKYLEQLGHISELEAIIDEH